MNKRFCKNNFEFFLGWGYTRGLGSKSNNRFVSFISALSILGIFLGVAALIIVLSVTNGFQREVRERMLSVVPHVQVYPAPDSPAGWELTLSQSIEKNKEVVGIAPYMSSQSIFLQDGEMVGVKVEGIDPMQEGKVSEVPKKIIQGRLDDLKEGEFNIVLGIELARRLGLEIKKDTFSLGEPVTLLMPETNFHTNEQSPRLFSFNVVGILNTGHFEIDKSFAYVHVNDAKKLFHEGNMGLRVKLKDMDQAKTVSRWIEDNASQPVLTQDWTSINPAWFSELQSFKVMISIILFIITIVGGFSLVSMLVMTVNDKQADIAILRTQGASRRSIMHIFMIQGAL
ncbi:ABC transporter permease, partial [Hydromonas duriensis]